MGDLVLGVAKTVVEGALTKVQSVIDEEAKLRQSVQRDLVFITGEFQMMQSFLNVADEERVRNNVVRTWVRQVRDLAYDVEDCIEFVVHLDKKPAWWRRVLPVPPCMPAAALPLDEAVAEIKQLKARVEDVSQRNMRYHLLTDSGSKPVAHTQQPTAIAAGATAFDILGEARDTARMQRGLGSLTELMAMPMEDHTSVALRVISVWGTGGDLGKTSLIRMAYDDPKICQNFGCRAWVKLVRPFNPHEFLRSLLVQFYANSCQGQGAIVGVDVLTRMKAAAATEKDLVEEFVKQVNEDRYLVVLEDLSTMVEWDSIRIYLPDRQNGSRVIVSTQQFEIASLCTGHPYRVSELKQFSADHSVCVFFKEGSHRDGNKEETDRDNGQTVGRKMDYSELKHLVRRAVFSGRFCVMSVWGIAGVGKSTLVKSLYDAYTYLDKYGWVNVSHPFNLRGVSRSLLWDLRSGSLQAKENSDNFGMLGIKDPIQECRELLREHRCLVVIDGLQSTEEWDLIKAALLVPGSSKSVVIVVTNEANVATHCADQQDSVRNVKGLEADKALDLFQNKVFSGTGTTSVMNSDMMEQAKIILSKCGGLPKIIVSICDYLANRPKETREWSSVCDNFMRQLETSPELDSLFAWMNSYFRTVGPGFPNPESSVKTLCYSLDQ